MSSDDREIPMTGDDITEILNAAAELESTDDAAPPVAEPETPVKPADDPEDEPEPSETDDAEVETPTEDEPEPAADDATPPVEPLVDESLRRVQFRSRLTDDQLKAMPPDARRALLERLRDDYAERDKMAGQYGSAQQRLRELEQKATPQPVPGQNGQAPQGPFELLDIPALQREYAEEFGEEAAKRLVAPAIAQNKTLEYLNQQHSMQQQQMQYQQQQAIAQLEQQIESAFAKPGMAELFGSGPTTQVDPEAQRSRIQAVQHAKFLIESGVAQSWEDALDRSRLALFPNTVNQPASDPASDPAEEQKAKVRAKRNAASTPRPNAPQGASAEIDPIDEVVSLLPPQYR